MGKFILRRVVKTIPVVILVSIVVFSFVLLLPGDPVIGVLGMSVETADPVYIAKMRHDLGLDQPIPIQYLAWAGRALHGDLGRSVATKQPVMVALTHALPVTLQLAVLGTVFALIIGIPLGIIAAVKHNSTWDYLASGVSVIGITLPSFWLAILLLYLFAVGLRWLPASGYVSVFKDPVDGVRHLLMPAFCLGLGAAAGLMRQVRSCLLEVLEADYVRTARAKGLVENVVLIRHALRNAMIPTVTIIGFIVRHLIGGSLILESIFLLPGMGSLVVNAIFTRDFLMVQGATLVIVLFTIVINLLVDISYAFLDPRIRLSG